MKLGQITASDHSLMFSLNKACPGGCPSLDGCTLKLRRTYNNGYTDIRSEYPASASNYIPSPPSFTGGGCVVMMEASDISGGDRICIQPNGAYYTINTQVNPNAGLECENFGGAQYDPDGVTVWATVDFGQNCVPTVSQNYSPIVANDVNGNPIPNNLSNTTPLGPLAGWTIEISCP